MINDLVSYGFRSIYHKLAWFERIHTLDIAQKINNPALEKMLDLTQIHFMAEDHQKIFTPKVDISGERKSVTAHHLIQLMTIMQISAIKNVDMWKKLEYLLEASYYQGLEQV